MTNEQFNKKYEDYLEEGHYGCDIDERLVPYLDKEFEKLVKLPGFNYAQIKCKFGTYLIYASYNEELMHESSEISKAQSRLNRVSTFFEVAKPIKSFYKWMLQNTTASVSDDYIMDGNSYTFEELLSFWIMEHLNHNDLYDKEKIIW